MRHKPIHYHVYPNHGDWEYEYSGNTQQVVTSNCDCADKLKQYENRLNLFNEQLQEISTYIANWHVGPVEISIDDHIDAQSPNPVQNMVIAGALGLKADASSLRGYTPMELFEQTTSNLPTRSQLKDVAFTGLYNDLIDAPSIPTVDIALDETSTNPVQNQAVVEALNAKANSSDIPIVDSALNTSSSHVVENRVIALAINDILSQLDNKVNSSSLSIYATKDELQQKADISSLSNYATLDDLLLKADKSQLSDYVTTNNLTTALSSKQNTLTEGTGISIINDEISVTLDTNPFVVVSSLSSVTTPDSNKIYILEETVGGETTYTEYRYENSNWVLIGTKDIGVDLTDYITEAAADAKYLIPAGTYLTKTVADGLYQPIGNYLLTSTAASLYQPKGSYITDSTLASTLSDIANTYQIKGNYVTNQVLEAMRLNIENTFQRKGNYLPYSEARTLFVLLQTLIDNKYVLKTDVRDKMHIVVEEWSQTTPTQMPISGNANPGQGGSSSGSTNNNSSNMVTLTESQYEALVANNLVDQDTYYFTYEDDTWTFGGTFPIKLT